MLYADIAAGAYIIDRIFGEFSFLRHPVVLMGDAIKAYEKRFYKDSLLRGAGLVVWTLTLTYATVALFTYVLSFLPEILAFFVKVAAASTTIAAHMLFCSVRNVAHDPLSVRYLVSRDTDTLDNQARYKAAMESYAENLSDGVIAPLFYLTLFGLEGAFIYKAVNTLDSMTGYRTARYERFGKVSAKIDDAFNFIPARITALLIVILHPQRKERSIRLRKPICKNAREHPSPNAGYPIAALAYVLNVTLGGPTRYFGKLHDKAHFGPPPPKPVYRADLYRALALQPIFDKVVTLFLCIGATL
jgi:adenosylcobinamide-phosphate synthase